MLDPFEQLLQHCWGHARSLRMVHKDLWVVFFPRCNCRSQTCWELLHPFAHHCQYERNNSQHCWRNNISISFVWIYQLKNNFEIDPAAVEKILIRRDDFYHALEHDIKPVSKSVKFSDSCRRHMKILKCDWFFNITRHARVIEQSASFRAL